MFLTSMEIAKEAKKEIDLDTLQSLCGQCGFYKECRTPKMKVTGEGKKKILLVSDRLSVADDDNGIQFAGESGKYLSEVLRKNGISMNKDCWKTSAIRCYSEKIKEQDANVLTPAKNCSGYLHKLIYTLKPELVILFSDASLISVLHDSFSDCNLFRWISYPFYDQKFDTTFLATFSPRSVTRKSFDTARKNIFERDIAVAISSRNISRRNKTDYEKYVKHLTTFKEVIAFLDYIIRKKPKVFIDYETSGLKPNRPGHFIATISFAISRTEAYSFPYVFNNYWTEKQLAEIEAKMLNILADKEILKMAQNAKFEDTWSYKFFCAVRGWYWDTMITSHILDNRKYFVNLKFQTFLRYGVRPYDKHIEQYLTTSKGTEFNTVHKAPLKELLTYNGLDCIFGYMLYEDQMKHLIELAPKGGLKNANSFLFRTSLLMARIQRNGIPMNEKYYKQTREKLTFKINKLKRELINGKEAKLFKEKFGRDINVASGPDLGKMFFEILEFKPVYTTKGGYKTDKETITKLNSSYGNKLLDIKKMVKARDTYLAQFDREVFNGMMYPFFDLHTARTYRSSSSKPNFQNLPKRDDEIKDTVRSGIVPGDLDEVLSEIDFSGAEVITSASYHKDPTFIAYLLDKNTDMHRDLACELWQLHPSMLHNPKFDRDQGKKAKKIRFYAKNNWTFAQFYGDWFDSCGRTLWENCIEREKLVLPNGTPLIEHCYDKGVYTLEDFLDHCKIVEDSMWNDRFPKYTKWKQDIFAFYKKHLYVETYYGFRFTGYMDRKQVCNYPIQGTSFHNLLNVMMDVERFIIKNKLRTKIIGQIHDSIISRVPKDEIEFYHKGVSNIIASLHERLDWLVVPMEAECAISKLGSDGGNISKMYEIKPKFLNGTEKFNLDKIYE